MSDLVDIAPKSWRPILLIGSLIGAGVSGTIWASSYVQKSATEASAPLRQRVEDHEHEDEQKWAQVQTELESIQRDVSDEKAAVVGLNAWVQAQESESSYAGPKRRHQ